MERPVEYADQMIKKSTFAIGAVILEFPADLRQKLTVDWLAVESPNAGLDGHNEFSLTAFPDLATPVQSTSLINDSAIYLCPSVSLEWECLCANHHFGRHAASPEQTRRHR